MLVLVVGDLHIPHRAADIPEQFKKLFMPGRINTIIVTGNISCREIHDYFRSVCPNVVCARGEFDDFQKDIPEFAVVEIEDIKIGVIHGHQVVPWGDKESLAAVQRRIGCDILVSGHTHQQKLFELDGKLFVNPGTITGAFSAFESDATPTFVLMEVSGSDARGPSVTSFIYSLEGTDLKIKKKEWTKTGK